MRIDCPSCATQLNVRDEHAGRAVRCPKCGMVIQPPGGQSDAPMGEVLPEATPAAEPDSPGITGRPVARATRPDDSPQSSRDRADESSRRERTRRMERDRDDRPPPASGSNTAVILLIVGFFMLSCCGAVGYGVYWTYNRIKEAVKQVKDDMEKWNTRVTLLNYERMAVGVMTRSQAESTLGQGRPATAEDLAKAFPDNADPQRVDLWVKMIAQNRAVVWRNGDDYLFAAFHPNANADSRLQVKEFRPKNGANANKGEPDDARFLKEFPPPPVGVKPRDPFDPKVSDDEPSGPLVVVSAKELTQAYKDDEAAANARFKDKWLLVDGTVPTQFGYSFDPATGIATVDLQGVRHPGDRIDFNVRCSSRVDSAAAMLNTARGQSLTIKGKCTGGSTLLTFVRLEHCRIDKSGPDPAFKTGAGSLILEFTKDSVAAGDKYKDKPIFITDAVFVSASGSLAMFKGGPKDLPIAIQANFTHNFDPRLAALKPGERVKFRAKAGNLFPHQNVDKKGPEKVISMYDAYLVP